MTKQQSELEEILKRFAEWTINNVEHGIYISLPSPETSQAIQALIQQEKNKARIGWTMELPDLPYFQIKAFDDKSAEWTSPIYGTKNLPAQLKAIPAEIIKGRKK